VRNPDIGKLGSAEITIAMHEQHATQTFPHPITVTCTKCGNNFECDEHSQAAHAKDRVCPKCAGF